MLTTAAAHDGDVNVIHWSRREPFLLSGGDDGALRVWDLRQFKVCSQRGTCWSSRSQQPLGSVGSPSEGVLDARAQPLRATDGKRAQQEDGLWLAWKPFYQPES